MRRFVYGPIVLLALVSATHAQQGSEQAQGRAQATSDKDAGQGLAAFVPENCFTSGSGSSFLKVCITENGNVSHLESPAGAVHLKTREGFAVCSYDGTNIIHGYDVGNAAEGWGPATVSANKRVITRTSLDGLVELKQTFTVVPANRGVDVKMELKNLSAVTLGSLEITRYFDGDIDFTGTNDYFHNGDSVWATRVHGLMMTLAPTTADVSLIMTPYSEWDPWGPGFQWARGCYGDLFATGESGDFVGGANLRWFNIKPGASKSATLHYQRF